jgi:hypothetical protein
MRSCRPIIASRDVSLAPGVRLGVYEILALIGAGEMGEVCRAHDTKLNRYRVCRALPANWGQVPGVTARWSRILVPEG